MNRIKSVILGTFLATISAASFSQNANAYEVFVPHDHVDHNVLIARYDHDRFDRARFDRARFDHARFQRLQRERIARERRDHHRFW
jgi:hypothetical protein